MAKKNLRKESTKALLARISKEMALPRTAQSVREKVANTAVAKIA